MSEISNQDLALLHQAHQDLESESLAMKVAGKVGVPFERLIHMLPEGAQEQIGVAVNKALTQCMHVALLDQRGTPVTAGSKRMHTWTTALTGAAGGFFGLAGLAVELPITTTVMLHAITDIARSHGEDMSQPEAALACLQVLAMGGKNAGRNDLAESAYYATRAALAQATRDAAAYVAEKGIAKEGAPALVAFISRIAARFGLEVSEKAAAQLVPVAGAAGGAALNVMFTNHFQRMAEGHFAVRSLERRYGAELVQAEYRRIGAGAVPA